MPTEDRDGVRYYGCWAGNPRGQREDETRCIMPARRIGWQLYQCSRKRGHGPNGEYCWQHARKARAQEGE